MNTATAMALPRQQVRKKPEIIRRVNRTRLGGCVVPAKPMRAVANIWRSAWVSRSFKAGAYVSNETAYRQQHLQ